MRLQFARWGRNTWWLIFWQLSTLVDILHLQLSCLKSILLIEISSSLIKASLFADRFSFSLKDNKRWGWILQDYGLNKRHHRVHDACSWIQEIQRTSLRWFWSIGHCCLIVPVESLETFQASHVVLPTASPSTNVQRLPSLHLSWATLTDSIYALVSARVAWNRPVALRPSLVFTAFRSARRWARVASSSICGWMFVKQCVGLWWYGGRKGWRNTSTCQYYIASRNEAFSVILSAGKRLNSWTMAQHCSPHGSCTKIIWVVC